MKEGNANVYDNTGWWNLGLTVADVGLGKHEWISTDGRPPLGLRNFIVLSDYNDAEEGCRDGVDVCLIWEENEISKTSSESVKLNKGKMFLRY